MIKVSHLVPSLSVSNLDISCQKNIKGGDFSIYRQRTVIEPGTFGIISIAQNGENKLTITSSNPVWSQFLISDESNITIT